MTLHRIHATELARLLNAAKQPIYVLDEDLTIVFVNRACHEWLGPAADELLGRTCVYHSGPAAVGVDAIAAALCPPPGCLAGDLLPTADLRLDEEYSFGSFRSGGG